MNSLLAERLKELRLNHKPKKLSQEFVANKLKVSDSSYQLYEYGQRDVPGDVLKRASEFYGVPVDYILGIIDTPFSSESNMLPLSIDIPGAHPVRGVPTSRVQLTGRVHAGPAGNPDVYEEVSEYVDIPQTYLDIDPECFAVDFEGDCMSKDFGDTTTLIVSPNSPFGNGSIVVVAIDGADYVVRRMEQNARELRLKPNSWNPEYKDIVIPRDEEHEVDYKGKVLGCFRRFE